MLVLFLAQTPFVPPFKSIFVRQVNSAVNSLALGSRSICVLYVSALQSPLQQQFASRPTASASASRVGFQSGERGGGGKENCSEYKKKRKEKNCCPRATSVICLCLSLPDTLALSLSLSSSCSPSLLPPSLPFSSLPSSTTTTPFISHPCSSLFISPPSLPPPLTLLSFLLPPPSAASSPCTRPNLFHLISPPQ